MRSNTLWNIKHFNIREIQHRAAHVGNLSWVGETYFLNWSWDISDPEATVQGMCHNSYNSGCPTSYISDVTLLGLALS